MKTCILRSQNSVVAAFPRDLLIWNYWDHEHIVGTHYKNYLKIKTIAEKDKWVLSERQAFLPFTPISTKARSFMYMESDNEQIVHNFGPFGLVLKQRFSFTVLGPYETKVTLTNELEVPIFLGWLQGLFTKVMKKWFWDVWEEDMPMRERRLKVWKLGFRDFRGIEYINKKQKIPDNLPDQNRSYVCKLPVPKISDINKGGISRPFSKSVEYGYGSE